MSNILPRHYITGIVIFVFFIVGGTTLLGLMNNQNDGFTDDPKFSEFNTSFYKMDDITTEVGGLESGITNASTNFGLFGVLNSLIATSWNSLGLMFESFSFMDSVFNGLSSVFGVPAWIPLLISLIITIMLIFAILSAIFQKEI